MASCTFSCHIIFDPFYALMELTMHMHAIGATEENTLVELDADPQEGNQEVQLQEVLGEGEPEVDSLPECPDHQPSAFVKGKPRSIISLPIFINVT